MYVIYTIHTHLQMNKLYATITMKSDRNRDYIKEEYNKLSALTEKKEEEIDNDEGENEEEEKGKSTQNSGH